MSNQNQSASGFPAAFLKFGLHAGLAIGILLFGMGIYAAMSAAAAPPGQKEKKTLVTDVDVIKISLQEVTMDISGYGTVRPQQEVDLIAQVAGSVVKLAPAFKKGGFVKKGDILIEIDDLRYQAALLSAQADVDAAGAEIELLKKNNFYSKENLELSKKKYALAKKDYDRYVKSRKKGSVSAQKVGQANANYVQERKSFLAAEEETTTFPIKLQKAQANLARYKAALMNAQANLDMTKIKAPFSAQVTAQDVQESKFVSSGAIVGRLAYDQVYEIPVMVDQGQLFKLPSVPADTLPENVRDIENLVGSPDATVEWSGMGTSMSWPGKLVRVEPIDKETRTVPLIIEVKDPWGHLKDGGWMLATGYYCKVTIKGDSVKKAVVIPETGIREDNTVYLLRDGVLALEKVRVLHRMQDQTVVIPVDSKQSWEGESLITSLIRYPIPGMPLKVRK